MRRPLILAMILFAAMPLTLGRDHKRAQEGRVPEKVNRDPKAARLITSDIDNFWKAYQQAGSSNRSEVFDREYFGKGSAGLRAFKRLRIDDCSFAKTIAKHPRYYASIKASTLKVAKMKGRIQSSFRRLKALYDDAVFPDVYFLIGCMNSGGVSTDTGLLIGTEMYGRTALTPEDELSEWHRQVLKPIEELPHIVAHELIHYEQKYPKGEKTLLAKAIEEGSADFIAELISGRHINARLHVYGNPKERELWEEFKREMHGKNMSNWLYNGSKVKDRPADLGYYMGYKICEAFYRRAPNKRRAVREMLEIKDFDQFLKASGYQDKFRVS